MKENKRYYIISAIILAVAVAMLLVFLLIPKGGKIAAVLNCNAENIQMERGETGNDFYQLSDENAAVEFRVDKEGIISIDKDKIIAQNPGIVNVEIVVTLNGQSISEYFVVTVLADDYVLNLISSSGCTINGNVLTITDSVCEFTIQLLDKNGQIITDKPIVVSASNGADCTMLFGVYRLSATENCVLTLFVNELDFSCSYNVVVA